MNISFFGLINPDDWVSFLFITKFGRKEVDKEVISIKMELALGS